MIFLGTALYFLLRSNTKIYALESAGEEYELIGKQRINSRDMTIDLLSCAKYPSGMVVIEINRMVAQRLFGKTVKVLMRNGFASHRIEQSGYNSYWFEISTIEEIKEDL